jgi:4-amino-4-deoxy-L-arabinose transferase-like glycosyltransferase
VIVAFLGLCLMAGGQAILANHESAAAFVNQSLGRFGPVLASFMMDTFGRGVALGLGLLLLGALLVAAVIGLPRPEGAPPHETPGDPTLHASVWQVAPGRAAVAGILTVVSLVGLSRSEPGMAAVIIWLGTLAAVFLLVRALDRARHSWIENPFHHRWEWIFVLALVAAVLVLVGHDLTHYRWAGTPDESFFFIAAKDMANGRLHPFPLSENGVFGYHPALSSYYQAAFLKVFGTNIFGWRLSSAIALAISLPFLYLFTREIWSRRAGVIAAVLFGTAQLAVGFAHFGYNNVQVYPVIFASLAILAWAIRCRSLVGHYLAGVIAGMGFYTFYTARLAPLLALLLLWSFGRLSLKRAGAELWALVVGILLAVLPVLIHPATLVAHILQQTAFANGAGPASSGWRGLASWWLAERGAFLKVWSDWLQSIFYASWSKSGSNFSWSPPVDPVVGALSVLGLWLGVLALLRRSRARFVTPAFLFSAFVVGAISQAPAPPLTRLLTLVPFTAILAAIALDRLMTSASRWVRWQAAVWLAGSALVAAAVIWNVTALHRSIYDLHYGFGSGTTSELIRMTQALPGNSRLVYIQNAENDMYDVDYILHEYNLGDRTTYIRPFGPQALTALGEISPPFAVVLDLKRGEEFQAVEGSIERRFPGVRWHDSAPGKQWNLRYCSVPAGLIVAQ